MRRVLKTAGEVGDYYYIAAQLALPVSYDIALTVLWLSLVIVHSHRHCTYMTIKCSHPAPKEGQKRC